MLKLIAVAAAAVIVAGTVTEVRAAQTGTKEIAEIEPRWATTTNSILQPRMRRIFENWRLGKELCDQGKDAEALQHVEYVRSHLLIARVPNKK